MAGTMLDELLNDIRQTWALSSPRLRVAFIAQQPPRRGMRRLQHVDLAQKRLSEGRLRTRVGRNRVNRP